MALPTTFRGSKILTFPAGEGMPGIRELQLEFNDTVSTATSPYTQTTDLLLWPGADYWTAQITMPQLLPLQASRWSAFLAGCRGMAGVFWLANPQHRSPAGQVIGTPVVAGTNPSMTSVLNTSGWGANAMGVLLPGDHLQIGYRLHVVTDPVDTDANGNAAIPIWPSIRETPAAGDEVILGNPQGLWRLAVNKRTMMTTSTRLSGVTLQLMEAR